MDALRTSIYVAIRTSPRRVRAALTDRDAVKGDEAAARLAEAVAVAVERHLEGRVSPAPSCGAGARE